MNWNLQDDLPIYPQLISEIKCAIVSGELEPGSKLSAVRDFAIEAKVNPNTMQRAMTELEREGLVYTQRTSGRFVTDDISLINDIRLSLAEQNISSFMDNMKRIGIRKKDIICYIEKYEEENNDNT